MDLTARTSTPDTADRVADDVRKTRRMLKRRKTLGWFTPVGSAQVAHRSAKKRKRAAVSEAVVAVAREVAACQKWQCAGSSCPLSNEYGNLPAEFEIDHINGDASNSRRSQFTKLQALCGICHNRKTSTTGASTQQRLQAAGK